MEQKAFDDTKRAIAHDNLLANPDLNILYDIHKDAIHFQIGSVISQGGKPISFCSRKLIRPQAWCTVTETEFLCKVKT